MSKNLKKKIKSKKTKKRKRRRKSRSRKIKEEEIKEKVEGEEEKNRRKRSRKQRRRRRRTVHLFCLRCSLANNGYSKSLNINEGQDIFQVSNNDTSPTASNIILKSSINVSRLLQARTPLYCHSKAVTCILLSRHVKHTYPQGNHGSQTSTTHQFQ